MAGEPLPIACSLPMREAAGQALEWTDLSRHIVSSEQLPDGLAVTYEPEVTEEVEDLVRRESACCSWLSITTAETDTGLRVTLESPNPDALPVIKVLAGVS